MLRRCLIAAVTVVIVLSCRGRGTADDDASHQWGSWRGPQHTGVAPHANPPTEWSEVKNVKWKVPLPGLGHASPIVWKDRVYVTSAVPFGPAFEPKPDTAPGAHDNHLVRQRHRFVILAFDRGNGKVVWKQSLAETRPHEGGHVTGSLASASPITDGENIFAFFGSHGLFCLDNDGKVVWEKQLGTMQTKHAHGEGSTPALDGDTLIVNWDHEGQSFIVALDKSSGKQKWKVDRDETTSWASPIVVDWKGKKQVIVNGRKRVRGYDFENGDVLWECGGLSDNVTACPVFSDGMVFAMSSYEKRALLAIKLDGARGDITGTDQVAWTRSRRTPYVPSPLLHDGILYYLRHYQPILSRVVAKSGAEPSGPFRLDGIREIYASPVAAKDRIYIADRSGMTLVMSTDETPKMIALNQLNDRFSATPALVGKEIFLRGERYLYCIGEKE